MGKSIFKRFGSGCVAVMMLVEGVKGQPDSCLFPRSGWEGRFWEYFRNTTPPVTPISEFAFKIMSSSGQSGVAGKPFTIRDVSGTGTGTTVEAAITLTTSIAVPDRESGAVSATCGISSYNGNEIIESTEPIEFSNYTVVGVMLTQIVEETVVSKGPFTGSKTTTRKIRAKVKSGPGTNLLAYCSVGGSVSGPGTPSVSASGTIALSLIEGCPCDLPVTITLFDPVPIPPYDSGLRGNSITDDRSTIMRSTLRPVDALVTDGVTTVVGRMTGCPSTRYAVSMFSQDGSAPTDYRNTVGDLALIASNDYAGTQLVNTDANGDAVFLYRAPREFVTSVADRALTIRYVKLRIARSGTVETDRQVALVRPMVVLVHGVWSSARTWREFTPVLRTAGLNHLKADYSIPAGASDGFASNAEKVLQQIRGFLHALKTGQLYTVGNIAASQVDIVAHSMGGMVTRSMAMIPSFAEGLNLGRGYVRRLITINTPHLGSQFADRLLQQPLSCRTLLGSLGMIVDAAGAVGDLATGSPMVLRTLRSNIGRNAIPSHAIVGTASQDQIGAANFSLGRAAVQIACPTIIGASGVNGVFAASNDLIVRADSMAAFTLGVTSAIPTTLRTSVIHTLLPLGLGSGPDVLNRRCAAVGVNCGPSDGTIPLAVVDLLNSNSSRYANILPTFGR